MFILHTQNTLHENVQTTSYNVFIFQSIQHRKKMATVTLISLDIYVYM